MNILLKSIRPIYLTIKSFTQRFTGATARLEALQLQNETLAKIYSRLQELENLENLVRYSVLTSPNGFSEQALILANEGLLPQFTDLITKTDLTKNTTIVKDYFVPDYVLSLINDKKVVIIGYPISTLHGHTVIATDHFFKDLRDSTEHRALRDITIDDYDYVLISNELLSSLTLLTPSILSQFSHKVREGIILYTPYSSQKQFVRFSDSERLSFSLSKIARSPHHFFNFITFHSEKFDDATRTSTSVLTKEICSKFTDNISQELENANQTTNFIILSRN